MSQPPKSTIFAPSARWVALRTVFWVMAKRPEKRGARIIAADPAETKRPPFAGRENQKTATKARRTRRSRNRPRTSWLSQQHLSCGIVMFLFLLAFVALLRVLRAFVAVL